VFKSICVNLWLKIVTLMEASEFDRILNQILSSFEVRHIDFDNPEFRPYKDRKIGGLVRIDTSEIMIDKNLSEVEEG